MKLRSPFAMENPALFFRSGALSLMLLLFVVAAEKLPAQTAPGISPAKSSAVSDEISQAELLKSYLRVREQLHDAELAITHNRLEAEATARAQGAAIAEKLDAIKSAIVAEHEHQAAENQRAAAEQERQRMAAQEMNRLVLWVAIAFAGVGLLTMLATAALQWRAINRLARVTAEHQELLASTPTPRLTNGNNAPSTEAVVVSNQRLMSVIDRMERRILELEHTTASPPPSTPAEVNPANTERNSPAAIEQAARISALFGKGRSLLNANKAEEALACFDEILAIDANLPEALVKKGSALERLKQDHAAIECYDRAIKVDRNMALAYLSKGGIFNRLQRFDEAVECYEKALQVEKEGKQTKPLRVSVSGEWPASGNSVPA